MSKVTYTKNGAEKLIDADNVEQAKAVESDGWVLKKPTRKKTKQASK